jgi:hypothetical protein
LHDGEWALSDDAWCCEVSGEYYLTDNEDPVVIHGLNFHPDTSAEDIAEAIKDRTGQENLFTPAAERAEVMAPIVVAPEQKVWIRANNCTHGSEEHRVTEEIARRMIHVGGWERFEKDPVPVATTAESETI